MKQAPCIPENTKEARKAGDIYIYRKRPKVIPGAQITESWTSSDTERLNLQQEGVFQTLELDVSLLVGSGKHFHV